MKNKEVWRRTAGLLLAALLVALPVAAEQSLVVWLKDGQKVIYDLKERPVTTFDSGRLVITTNALTISYAQSEVLRYTYQSETSDISDLDSSQTTRFSIDDGTLTLANLKVGTTVHVYSANGVVMRSLRVSESGTVSRIPLRGLTKGVYLVKVNDAVHKIRL